MIFLNLLVYLLKCFPYFDLGQYFGKLVQRRPQLEHLMDSEVCDIFKHFYTIFRSICTPKFVPFLHQNLHIFTSKFVHFIFWALSIFYTNFFDQFYKNFLYFYTNFYTKFPSIFLHQKLYMFTPISQTISTPRILYTDLLHHFYN